MPDGKFIPLVKVSQFVYMIEKGIQLIVVLTAEAIHFGETSTMVRTLVGLLGTPKIVPQQLIGIGLACHTCHSGVGNLCHSLGGGIMGESQGGLSSSVISPT